MYCTHCTNIVLGNYVLTVNQGDKGRKKHLTAILWQKHISAMHTVTETDTCWGFWVPTLGCEVYTFLIHEAFFSFLWSMAVTPKDESLLKV